MPLKCLFFPSSFFFAFHQAHFFHAVDKYSRLNATSVTVGSLVAGIFSPHCAPWEKDEVGFDLQTCKYSTQPEGSETVGTKEPTKEKIYKSIMFSFSFKSLHVSSHYLVFVNSEWNRSDILSAYITEDTYTHIRVYIWFLNSGLVLIKLYSVFLWRLFVGIFFSSHD